MSLVGQVGRRRGRARLAMGTLYLLLTLGAITTVYPFVLMFATGLDGPTDQNDNRLIPLYTVDGPALLAKYVDDKYAGDASQIASTRASSGPATPANLQKYRDFLAQLPIDDWQAGFRIAPSQVTSKLAMRYRDWLHARYKGNIDALNRAYLEEDVAFQTVEPPAEQLDRKVWRPTSGLKYAEWREFKASLPTEFRVPVRETFMWQRFLMAKYQNQLAATPPEIRGTAAAFEEIPLPPITRANIEASAVSAGLSPPVRTLTDPSRERMGPGSGARQGTTGTTSAALLAAFRAQEPSRFATESVEAKWEKFEGAGFGSTGSRSSHARQKSSFEAMPIAGDEANFVNEHSGAIRREFAARNYRYVLDYILINGRTVWNTFLFCALAIVTQLTVNPLAAYALSRYPVRQSGQILIFLLATMAFPAEVAMIPSFLLLKNLGLLNTFAALVLPSAASGYMIFLLKGFFDSLPQELFEAAGLDGARETTMMLRIAMPLSRPVLGYLALLAFMGAYGSFIYAFLVAQDQRIWTLMVWIYQLQNSAPKAVMMAALTLAAVPTLLVFLLAQRVIMQGIVLPGER